MDNLIEIKAFQLRKKNQLKIEKIKDNIAELREVEKTLHNSIINLTKYDKYSSIRRRIDDLFVLYQDIKRTIKTRVETLERLENELEQTLE